MPQAVVRAFVGEEGFQRYTRRQSLLSGRDRQLTTPAFPMQAGLRERKAGPDNQRDVAPIAHAPYMAFHLATATLEMARRHLPVPPRCHHWLTSGFHSSHLATDTASLAGLSGTLRTLRSEKRHRLQQRRIHSSAFVRHRQVHGIGHKLIHKPVTASRPLQSNPTPTPSIRGSHYVLSQTPTWFHIDRTTCGYCHHRHPRGTAAPSRSAGS